MYIWKTDSLAEDIKNNAIGQGEWKKYYLVASVFMTLAMYVTATSPRENLVSVLVEALAVIGIVIFGVNFTYQSNKGDYGVDYIARMTALAIPIMIKLFLLALLVGFFVGALTEPLSLSEEVIDWFMVGFSSVMQAVLFWRINIYIKYINT